MDPLDSFCDHILDEDSDDPSPGVDLYPGIERLMKMEYRQRQQQSAEERMQDFVLQLKDKLGVEDLELIRLCKQAAFSSPNHDDDGDDVLYEFEHAASKRSRWTQIRIGISFALGYLLYADRSSDNKAKQPAFPEPIAYQEQWELEHEMPYRHHIICPTPMCQRVLDSRAVRLGESQLPSTSANPIGPDEFGDIISDCCLCPFCGMHFCYQCRQPWHNSQPCSEVLRFKWIPGTVAG